MHTYHIGLAPPLKTSLCADVVHMSFYKRLALLPDLGNVSFALDLCKRAQAIYKGGFRLAMCAQEGRGNANVDEGNWRQLLEVSVALEIVKTERDECRKRTLLLEKQLAEMTQRAHTAEQRWQETTEMLFQFSRDILSSQSRSTVREVVIDGRSILRLEQPIIDPIR